VALSERPELAHIAPHLRLWSDRYQPPAGEEDEELSSMPDLGPVFEFQARSANSCPGLERIHCFCYPAAMSHGQVSGDIPAISEGAQRLAQGLASLFYREDVMQHEQTIHAFADPELLGDEWPAADLIDRMVPLAENTPLHAVRHQRAKVVKATQQSHDALFSPGLGDVPLRERLLVAWYACTLTPHAGLAAHYRARLDTYAPEATLCQAIARDQLDQVADARLRALLQFTRTLILKPVEGDRQVLNTLPQAGYSTPAIVALAQLIAFLSYQTRLVSGLSALQQARAASQEKTA
jgi:CMD domain protein